MTAGALARRIRVQGRIQGVGYRPFVLRLALRHDVRGWVRNQGGYVEIHAEGAVYVLHQRFDVLFGTLVERNDSQRRSTTTDSVAYRLGVLDSFAAVA